MPNIPEWVGQYIGLPYAEGGRTREGIDCWGLIVLVLREQFNVVVPSYDHMKYSGHECAKELGEFFNKEKVSWTELEVDEAKTGDGLLIRMIGHPIHAAIVVAPDIMLHIEEGINSVWEEFNTFQWRKRIVKAYRYAP